MKNKKENQRERELRLKAQMKENLLKRNKLVKSKATFNENPQSSSLKDKGKI